MTKGKNYTIDIGCTLNQDAKAADEAIYTIQAILSVCKHVADSPVHDADMDSLKVTSIDLATSFEHLKNLLNDVGDLTARIDVFSSDKKYNANYTMQSDRELHEDAKTTDAIVHTVQSLLAVCRQVAINTVCDADKDDTQALSVDMALCLEQAEKMLFGVGEFVERVIAFTNDKLSDQRQEAA